MAALWQGEALRIPQVVGVLLPRSEVELSGREEVGGGRGVS